MEIFDCLLKFNLRVCEWVVITFTRLTPFGKLFVVFVTLTTLCLPFGVRNVLHIEHPDMEQDILRPIMNYNNITTAGAFYTSESLSSTAVPTTLPPTNPTTEHHKHPSEKAGNYQLFRARGDEGENTESSDRPQRLKNVLFLISDDFRALPQHLSSGTSKQPKLYLPNIERLASESLVLERAYCQYSLCGPSRTSLLTSRSPDTTKVYQNYIYWRESAGSYMTMPQYFKENGYKTFSLGKVFHIQMHRQRFDPVSWSGEAYIPRHMQSVRSIRANWMPIGETERKTHPLEDEQSVIHARKLLKRLAMRSRARQEAEPFFMGIGFYRPHLPMICPEEFFEKYPLEEGERYLADVQWQTPLYYQSHGMASFVEGTEDNSNLTHIPDMALRQFRRSYFACMSYVDYLIGTLLDVLDELGLTETTIVSFVADHGFHLGENNVVSKYTTHEIAVHVPLIIKVPGLTDGGITSRSLVESLDIFPTLTAAAGLAIPPPCPERSTDVTLCVEGKSLLPLVVDPDLALHNATYSQVSRGRNLTEYSIRTDRIRYVDFASFKRIPLTNKRLRLELVWNINLVYTGFHRKLYDLARDPNERFNLQDHPDYTAYREHMKNMLRKKFSVIHDFPIGLS